MPRLIGEAFGKLPALQNERSKHKTTGTVYIDSWYASLQIIRRWSWERYVLLCNMVKMTPYEMASLIGMPHKSVRYFEYYNQLPAAGRLSTALLLTLVEAHFMGELHHDTIRNPFPDLRGKI